jgi:predicted  nucleic acid-binding Zn-ribbon protein
MAEGEGIDAIFDGKGTGGARVKEEKATIEDRMSVTGGFSAEAHLATLDKIKEKRKQMAQGDKTEEETWKDYDRQIAEAMGIAPNQFMKHIYDALTHVGINLYKVDAKRSMDKFKAQDQKLRKELVRYEERLEGKVEYISPQSGLDIDKLLEKNKHVRESEKGLRYKLAEATDEARVLGYQYRNGIIAVAKYRDKISKMDQDIEALQQNVNDPTSTAKISKLQTEKTLLENEKGQYVMIQKDYESELQHYDKKIEQLQGRIALYEKVIKKGEKRLNTIESGIEILDDYVRHGEDLKGVHELLHEIVGLDDAQITITNGIKKYDEITGKQLDSINAIDDASGDGYSSRPLLAKIENSNKQDEVSSAKDMDRILTKLGIALPN